MLEVLPFATKFVDACAADVPCFQLPASSHPRSSALLHRLQQHILLHVGVHAPERIFLHAGAVAWRDRAILFPGASCAGKTTLVAELVRLGALYYSDDYAILDATGMVHPYAPHLQVRDPGGLYSRRLGVTDLSGQAGEGPIAVAQVFITSFDDRACWSPEPLGPGAAVLEMLRNSIAARRKPAEVLRTLRAVAESARTFRSPRGDARLTARLILEGIDANGLPA